MEDVSMMTQLINNCGFPIACCIAMGIYIYYLQKQHKEETKELTTAVANNTIVLQKLVDLLDRKE